MNIKLPSEVYQIIDILNSHGYQAFAVGGCIRDSILGRHPKDWDITTDAKPKDIQGIFDSTIATGIKHGTVTVLLNKNSYEVTTFRIDGEYKDNRRPDFVEFTSSVEDDLSRRDFTMNAIAYHPNKGIIDPFSGISDIASSTIRAIGIADKRFKEDALRMLRAIRFSAQLGFSIEQDTLFSIKNNSHLIKNISVERIRDELSKLLCSDNPSRFLLLKETDILKYIIPEFDICFEVLQNNPYHISNVAMHSLHSAENIDNDITLRWTMLLHDIGKPDVKAADSSGIDHFYCHEDVSSSKAEAILKRLRFDNSTINTVCTLIKHHGKEVKPELKAVRRAINTIGEQFFEDWIKIKAADIKAQSGLQQTLRLESLKSISEIYCKIQAENQCISLKKLAVNGEDLLASGIQKGKQIGIILNKLLKLVIDNPELNNKELLLRYAIDMKNSD